MCFVCFGHTLVRRWTSPLTSHTWTPLEAAVIALCNVDSPLIIRSIPCPARVLPGATHAHTEWRDSCVHVTVSAGYPLNHYSPANEMIHHLQQSCSFSPSLLSRKRLDYQSLDALVARSVTWQRLNRAVISRDNMSFKKRVCCWWKASRPSGSLEWLLPLCVQWVTLCRHYPAIVRRRLCLR